MYWKSQKKLHHINYTQSSEEKASSSPVFNSVPFWCFDNTKLLLWKRGLLLTRCLEGLSQGRGLTAGCCLTVTLLTPCLFPSRPFPGQSTVKQFFWSVAEPYCLRFAINVTCGKKKIQIIRKIGGDAYLCVNILWNKIFDARP